eukprot:366338-Chlamydomonas_euryale.AAC.16
MTEGVGGSRTHRISEVSGRLPSSAVHTPSRGSCAESDASQEAADRSDPSSNDSSAATRSPVAEKKASHWDGPPDVGSST